MEATSETGELTPIETAKLENLEELIRGGLKSCFEVGRALRQIRDERLYRGTHGEFDLYCQDTFDIASRYAHLLIAGTKIKDVLSAHNCARLPENEAQVRPLTKLPDDEVVE